MTNSPSVPKVIPAPAPSSAPPAPKFGTNDAVNMAAFIATVVQREKQIVGINTDGIALIAGLKVGIATAALFDLIKKAVIYGKEIDSDQFFAANAEIEKAIDGFDQALCREVADDYMGEAIDTNVRLAHGIIGKFGEAGELVSALVNQLEGRPLDFINVIEELGDDAWYNGLLLDELRVKTGAHLPDILARNEAKLKARHGAKFSVATSDNRDVAAERKVLEAGQGTDSDDDEDSIVPEVMS